ncbi:MAG TPA: glutamine--fructose-6-phosphate transaminase (isomerizing) [Bacilli bacterium]|nr:glutamine--fructose-6-phosphate transaminase (isomerizing) [Bacilli bacterium]
MCGIVGYIGNRQAQDVLLHGLSKLEYRGYDSAGIAVMEQGEVGIKKSVGRLAKLAELVDGPDRMSGSQGIGHTRWATHGRPSEPNAHPHTGESGLFTIVHNGIIENYMKLRDELVAKGHEFKSETDSEVVAHLLEDMWTGDLFETVVAVNKRLHGAFALGIMCKQEPGKLIAVRRQSPLVIGLGENENFIASDIPAILEYTRNVYILDDGEMAVLTAEGVKTYDVEGNPTSKDVYEVNWSASAAEKGGYDHFMLKEIHDQPQALRDTLTGRVSEGGERVLFDELQWPEGFAKKLDRIHIVACGTSWHAGMVGAEALERLTRIPVSCEIASEYRYRDPIVTENTLIIVITQSGETMDTLAALREGKAKGTRVLAITNVVGSSAAREADDVIFTWAGPEISVASTKAYTTQLTALYLFAGWLAQEREAVGVKEVPAMIEGLRQMPELAEQVLANSQGEIEAFARSWADKENAFFIGRSLDYAVSLEGSLKLKEISYMHAEAYPAGELKHGTLALIVEDVPVIALVTQDQLWEKTVSNITEVKARDAFVLGLAWEDDKEIEKYVNQVIRIPRVNSFLAPVLTVIPLQLLAYYASVARGNDVDNPRNLAKSVTVE